eukprot:5346098-Alexandrium_andersonii.AAC.1
MDCSPASGGQWQMWVGVPQPIRWVSAVPAMPPRAGRRPAVAVNYMGASNTKSHPRSKGG